MAPPDNRNGRLALVTVIVPSYNHAAYVADTIRSVIDQSYPAVELIVVDDCSPDDSRAIIAPLAERHGFTFIHNKTNLGLNSSIEAGLAAATGDYVAILASDDMILPDKIARQVAYIRDNALDGVYASGVKLFEDGRREPIEHDTIARHWAAGTILDHIYITDTDGPLMQSGLFSKAMMRELLPYRRQFKSDDHMFLIKGLESYRIGFMPERLFVYRIHGNQMYRRHWYTLLLRMEIAAQLTPEPMRPRYIANIFHSQAEFLFLAGQRGMALKFLFASFMLWPSPKRIARVLAKTVRGAIKHG